MSLIATAEGNGNSARTMIPEGSHAARCYSVVDLGTHDETWQGKARKRRKVTLGFEFPGHTHVFAEEEGPKPLGKLKTYTNSLSEKAVLRKNLQSWRGRSFTQKELAGFDLATVAGHGAMVGIVHITKDNGDKTDVIDSIVKPPEGMAIPDKVNEPYTYSIDEHPKNWDRLSKWAQGQIQASDEWKAKNSTEPEPAAVVETDNVPF